jgi:two-component SAPR family response regulator
LFIQVVNLVVNLKRIGIYFFSLPANGLLIFSGLKGILSFIILLFFGTELRAQTLSDQTYLITDLTSAPLSETTIKTELRYRSVGLYIQLNYQKEKESLVLTPVKSRFTFDQFSGVIKQFLADNKKRILPIFIDYAGPVSILNEAFIKSGLSEFAYFLPTGERWPGASEIIRSNKNLIVFTFQKPNPGNTIFHYTWDYIAEYPHSGNEDPLFDGHFINGDITKELLLIRDMEIPSNINNQGQFVLDINQNQFYINHLLNRWKNTGKQPNFIFAGRNARFLSPLIPWLTSYKSVKGVVKINDKPMEKVFWKHSNKSITNGYFCFPYSEGEELNLTPFSPGFVFNPQTSIVSAENLIQTLSFSASPIPMSEGLTAYFPFDKNWNNLLDKNETIVPVNASFTSDVTKGEVAKLPQDAYIKIGTPEKYGIRNNSFSVSAWVKLNEVNVGKEYSILGSPEGLFRKGLHLIIRQGHPYFGFYGNDLWAEKVVEPNVWFHIVFRYNFFNGEQAIYVDGQNVGASFNHASFIGDSLLEVGKSITSRNFLNGYIDDLYIWNRPLGEEEIKYLYNTEYKPVIKEKRKVKPESWIIPGVAILVVIALYFSIRLKKKDKPSIKSLASSDRLLSQNKNALYLFGDFQIYDSKGEELSQLFTPKIKELFLVIFLSTAKNKKGIKTEKLTSILWDGFQPQKAANNRSVTFNKLRKIISGVNGLTVEFLNGYWKIEIGKNFYCDYTEVFPSHNKKEIFSKHELSQFFNAIKRGVFLNEVYWDWLDEFKEQVASDTIDNLLAYASKLSEKEESQQLKAVAEHILLIDDLNEKALQILIRLMISGNSLHKARFRYTQFQSKFNEIYGEPFKLSFEEFINEDF